MRIMRSITVTLVALLLLAPGGCGSEAERRVHAEALSRMDSAAALIEENPDSALSLLQAVDSAGLTDQPTQARFSLLMARAIEKISDITDMAIVQSAKDYYTDHGSPTDQMIMYYHVGCVYKSQNEYLKALESFNQAEMHGKDSKDTLSLARTLAAEGTIYFTLQKWDEYLHVNQRAAALFLQIGDSARYYNTLLRVAVAYSRQGDWNSQIKYLRKVKNEYPIMTDSLLRNLYYPELLYHYQNTVYMPKGEMKTWQTP